MIEKNVRTSTVEKKSNQTMAKNGKFQVIGALRYTETINMICEYQKTRKENLLKQLIQKVLNEKLEDFEYLELYKVDNKALKSMVILKAPVAVMQEIVLNDENFKDCKILTKKMVDEPFKLDFVDATNEKVRIWAVDYEDEEVLAEKLFTEKNKKVVDKILERLKNYSFSNEQIEKLLNAECFKARMHAVDYASKEKLVERLLIEKEDNVSAKIIHFLDGYKFSRKDANKLISLSKTYWIVRKNAAKYASKKYLIDALFKESYLDVIDAILKRLENFKITTKEADYLMDSNSTYARKFAISYASNEKLLKVLLLEKELGIVLPILDKMKNYDFSKCEIEKFFNAPCWCTREYLAKFASKDELFKWLLVEKNEDVETSILKSLEKLGDLTQEEADKLIDMDEFYLALNSDLIKYISDDKIVKILLKSIFEPLNEEILKSLEGKNLKEDVANELLNAKSWKIRKYATKYASKDKLFERLAKENKDEVIIQILEMIK